MSTRKVSQDGRIVTVGSGENFPMPSEARRDCCCIRELLEANDRYLRRALAAEAEVERLKRKFAGTSEGRALRFLRDDAY